MSDTLAAGFSGERRRFLIAVVVAVIGLAPLSSVKAETLEHMMATLNAGTFVRADDVTVARFRFLLDGLSAASGEKPERIGDMLVVGKRWLVNHYGKSTTLLELTERAYRERNKIDLYEDMAEFLTMAVVDRIGKE